MKLIPTTLIMVLNFLFFTNSFSQSLLNGSFENNTAGTSQVNLSNSQFNAMMASCTSFGTLGDLDIITGNVYCDYPQNGNWYIAFTGNGTDMVAMELSAALIQGNTYTLTFYDRGCTGWTPYPFDIGVSTTNFDFGDTVLFSTAVPLLGTWTKRSITFSAPNNGSYVTVTMNAGSISDWAHIDNLELTPMAVVPQISLSASDTSFCEKQCIDFTDLSTNNPTSWHWFFPGATTSTSTLQNPTNICYNTYGSFDVTLIACNAAGCDTLFLPGFITEYPFPSPSITQSNDTLFSSPAVAYQWWSTDSGIIAGATNPYYIPTQAGSYFVVVTDTVGCNGPSNILVISSVHELAVGSSQLAIFPNPNNGSFTISLNKPVKEYSLHIINSIGQTVARWQSSVGNGQFSFDVDLGDAPKGLYVVELITNEKVYRQQFVKE